MTDDASTLGGALGLPEVEELAAGLSAEEAEVIAGRMVELATKVERLERMLAELAVATSSPDEGGRP
ncbi:hypothetical protein [Streptomyces hoynatensis]|uniref:hypothetical protein n=1 Tax=Streptomyces hoynatensis TaxID=1141874 RepID=UPI0011C43430|nr:hypothetical protein [Streptomyces hoynatensis]